MLLLILLLNILLLNVLLCYSKLRETNHCVSECMNLQTTTQSELVEDLGLLKNNKKKLKR